MDCTENVINDDARANYRTSVWPRFYGDNVWKYIVALRIREYLSYIKGIRKILWLFPRGLVSLYLHHASLKLGFCIPLHVCGSGLCLAHYGSIIINEHAIIGQNVCIHPGV